MANSDSINHLKKWFEQTLAWLNADRGADPLQDPHKQLLEIMEKAHREKHPNEVWEIIEELEQLTIEMTSIQEQGDIFLKCARMACDLENLREAARLCAAAENKFRSYPHQYGVAKWMNGCIQWALHQRVKAIASWREAIHLFETRRASVQLDSKRVKWYNDMIPELKDYLEEAIREDKLPRFKEETGEDAPPSPAPDSSTDSLKLLSIPVSDTVPAGGFGAVGYETKSSPLQVTEVFIENERYSVHSIRRNSLWQNSVVVSPTDHYHTVRVSGNSMNNAKPVPIENGDYVLVKERNKAEDHDIVVASLEDTTDPRATVKRLRLSANRTLQLRPESLDPGIQNHPAYEREYIKEEVQINGVVEAVFKKKQ